MTDYIKACTSNITGKANDEKGQRFLDTMTTKTTGQRTPGPWHHATRKDKRESIILDSALTPEGNIPKGTNWIASVYPVSTENDHISNAAFIVRACNSHNALAGALQDFIDAATESSKNESYKANAYGFMMAVLPKARAAIAAATKE